MFKRENYMEFFAERESTNHQPAPWLPAWAHTSTKLLKQMFRSPP